MFLCIFVNHSTPVFAQKLLRFFRDRTQILRISLRPTDGTQINLAFFAHTPKKSHKKYPGDIPQGKYILPFDTVLGDIDHADLIGL